MIPIQTPDTNAVFVVPGCGDLPATKCHDPETGRDYVQTVWQLSVSVMGNGIQPILVSTESILADEKDGEA